MRRFNPRTHVGCDIMCIAISIHLRLFQSTHPRRVRLMERRIGCNAIMFQSTHPRRVRHRRCAHNYFVLSFNPRTHVGCDVIAWSVVHLPWLFQSTHPRRVRLIAWSVVLLPCPFQSTHPRRVRLLGCRGLAVCIEVSIHAPT